MSDYKNFMTKLYEATTFVEADELPQGWKDYLLENRSSEYATILVGTLPGQRYEFYTNSNFN